MTLSPRNLLLAAALCALAAPLDAETVVPRAVERTAPWAAAAQAGASTYLTGGTKPLSANLQSMLDRHAGKISLGINVDWMEQSGIDAGPFVDAIDILGEAVDGGVLPGAVIYVDRFPPSMMPVAVGFQTTVPNRVPARYSLLYDVKDLTGPLIVAPLAWQLLGEGRLALSDDLGALLPAAPDAAKTLTVEMLLRHSSGLTPKMPWQEEIRFPDDLLAFLTPEAFVAEPGTMVIPSPWNMALLGLIVERVSGEPLSELAAARLGVGASLSNSCFDPPDDWRSNLAPGSENFWLDRLEWGEAGDPVTAAFWPNAGFTGLHSNADDLALHAGMLATQWMVSQAALATSATLFAPFSPDPALGGRAQMGLGLQVNKFGEHSFGWDGQWGRSVWVLPDRRAVIVFLSNPEHPVGLRQEALEVRDEVLAQLVKSLRLTWEPVDTEAAGDQPRPSPIPAPGKP